MRGAISTPRARQPQAGPRRGRSTRLSRRRCSATSPRTSAAKISARHSSKPMKQRGHVADRAFDPSTSASSRAAGPQKRAQLARFPVALVRHQPNEESGGEQPEDRNPRGFEQQKEDEKYRGNQEDERTHVAGNSNRARSALPLRVHQSVATRADCPSHSIRKKPRGSGAFRN